MCTCILQCTLCCGDQRRKYIYSTCSYIVEVKYSVILTECIYQNLIIVIIKLNVHCRNSCQNCMLFCRTSITIIPGVPLTVLGDSPVAAVDYSVVEAVDHHTSGASMTPSRKAAKRRQAAGRSWPYVIHLLQSMKNYQDCVQFTSAKYLHVSILEFTMVCPAALFVVSWQIYPLPLPPSLTTPLLLLPQFIE